MHTPDARPEVYTGENPEGVPLGHVKDGVDPAMFVVGVVFNSYDRKHQ
jgi:hypothetical protein